MKSARLDEGVCTGPAAGVAVVGIGVAEGAIGMIEVV